jgi:hypothetical protein
LASASHELIAADFTREHPRNFSIRKEILWELNRSASFFQNTAFAFRLARASPGKFIVAMALILKARCWLVLVWLLARWPTLAGDSIVVFSEIMYHPRDGDALEWVELHNQMAVDVDISGWEIDGIGYRFPTNTVITGGAYLVVASNPSELARRAGLAGVFGPFSGRLANEGEQLRLRNHNRRIMDELDYETNDPWPVGPDGSGFALAKRDANLASASAENWISSAQTDGTPGRANFPGGVPNSPILLNEIAASTNETFWVEILNSGSSETNLAGFELEFSRAPERRSIMSGTNLAAGG